MLDNKPRTVAIALSGGRGSRMGSDIPKQYMEINGYPLIYYSLKVFQDSFIDEIVLVCGSGDEDYCKREIVEKYDFTKVSKIVTGGKERYHSVANGLNAIDTCDIVFVHDGARPLITDDILKNALEETLKHKATVVAVPAKDTIKISDDRGFAKETPNRNNVWIMQTPQTFIYNDIRDAYNKLLESEDDIKKRGIAITDDAMVMEFFGNSNVKFVMGSYSNIKVTTPEDVVIVSAMLDNNCN